MYKSHTHKHSTCRNTVFLSLKWEPLFWEARISRRKCLERQVNGRPYHNMAPAHADHTTTMTTSTAAAKRGETTSDTILDELIFLGSLTNMLGVQVSVKEEDARTAHVPLLIYRTSVRSKWSSSGFCNMATTGRECVPGFEGGGGRRGMTCGLHRGVAHAGFVEDYGDAWSRRE